MTRDDCTKAARAFRARLGLDAPDENVIATIHLMNRHGLDQSIALDQSSRSANDNGIDAWYYDHPRHELSIYQSKLSESRTTVAWGFSDLERGLAWLENVIVNGAVDQIPSNPSLYNLYNCLSSVREDLRRISFVLISPIESNQLENLEQFEICEKALTKSRLNEHLRAFPGGRIALSAEQYDLERGIPRSITKYSVERIPNTRVELRATAHLDLAYLTLFSLVNLYRQRGELLFDKNVRLSLFGNKEAKDRLVNPMERTLDDIVNGQTSPSIFPFYHIGVTVAASATEVEGETVISLETPSIINGCQTIVIGNEFLKKLERQKAEGAIDRFKQIKVIAKVVVGTTTEELKEITNSNNRQNPIDNWQLFSNEPVHIELEAALKDLGVFYERQKGKFDSVMKNADNVRAYPNTNGTYVRVLDLAQLVALARQNFQWAAKPSEVFINRESHDRCFDNHVVSNPRDVIFTWNLYKAFKRSLNNYLALPAHASTTTPSIFSKPIIRAHVHSVGLLYFYQSDKRRQARLDYSTSLNKKASARLVEEVHNSYLKQVVTNIRNWYLSESKDLSVEVSKRRMDVYFSQLGAGLGVDEDGEKPFSAKAIDWRHY